MSRSRKKRPGGGITTAASDKPFKRQEHRRERRNARTAVLRGGEDFPTLHRIYGNPWASPKDGKQFWQDHDDRWMRK